ncbi:MAG TPA: FtsX-like permease family protein [Alphaproteobacteria bacterium]|nr:FtsX-like permease family protein [Alphaproteobacteria bacterium]
MARRYDLYFRQDASGRFVPLIIGAMVYLAALALSGSMVIGHIIEDWNEGLRGTLTIQVPAAGPASAVQDDTRVDTALATLFETPGVADARALPPDDIQALLKPWFGEDDLPAGLPVPALIDVTLEPGARIDSAALADLLDQAVPGTQLFDNGAWLDRLVRFARSVQWVAGIVVALVAVSAIAIIVFVTRAGLSMHRRTIELLHVIGARDGYIARQFQFHSLALGFMGGVLGLAVAAVTLVVLALLAERAGAPIVPRLSLSVPNLIALGALPLVSAAIATLTARAIVMRALRAMP